MPGGKNPLTMPFQGRGGWLSLASYSLEYLWWLMLFHTWAESQDRSCCTDGIHEINSIWQATTIFCIANILVIMHVAFQSLISRFKMFSWTFLEKQVAHYCRCMVLQITQHFLYSSLYGSINNFALQSFSFPFLFIPTLAADKYCIRQPLSSDAPPHTENNLSI